MAESDELMATDGYPSRPRRDAQPEPRHHAARTKPVGPASANTEEQLNAAARQIVAARHITFGGLTARRSPGTRTFTSSTSPSARG